MDVQQVLEDTYEPLGYGQTGSTSGSHPQKVGVPFFARDAIFCPPLSSAPGRG